MPLPLLSSVLLTSVAEAGGQAALRWAQQAASPARGLLGVAFYAVVCAGLYNAYHHKGVGVVNALWSGTSVVLMVIVGMVFFHERLSPAEWTGVAFVLVGLAFLASARVAAHLRGR
jgi:multidrug transporter EmrE-like cation transporter